MARRLLRRQNDVVHGYRDFSHSQERGVVLRYTDTSVIRQDVTIVLNSPAIFHFQVYNHYPPGFGPKEFDNSQQPTCSLIVLHLS